MDVKNTKIDTSGCIISIDNKIKHIVISGGLVYGYTFYGCLQKLAKNGMWNIDNILSIYSTSVGTIFSTILSLKYDWDTIDAYIVDRPWQTVFTVDMNSIINCYSNRGIFSMDIIDKVFAPLFAGKNISIDITLKGFFEITGIELHYYTTSLHDFELVDISYITHPDWKVTDAIYVSCSAPIFFAPLIKDNIWYTDGGFISNYPIEFCLKSHYMPTEDEIIGIRMTTSKVVLDVETSSLFDYIGYIFRKFASKIENCSISIKNEIVITQLDDIPCYNVHVVMSSSEKRRQLINYGIELADKFLLKRSTIQ